MCLGGFGVYLFEKRVEGSFAYLLLDAYFFRAQKKSKKCDIVIV